MTRGLATDGGEARSIQKCTYVVQPQVRNATGCGTSARVYDRVGEPIIKAVIMHWTPADHSRLEVKKIRSACSTAEGQKRIQIENSSQSWKSRNVFSYTLQGGVNGTRERFYHSLFEGSSARARLAFVS